MNLNDRFGNYIDKKTENMTEKEEKISLNIVLCIVGLLLLFSFLISIIFGVIYLIYYIVAYYVVSKDLLDEKYFVIFLFPVTLVMIIVSIVYGIVTPYRGDDVKIIRKEKLKKIKRKKLFKL